MRTSSIGDVRKMYDENADRYSQMMDEDIQLPMYGEALSSVVGWIRKIEGPILDTACGSGHMLEKLKTDFAPERELLGVDISPRMVAIAQKRLGESATIVEGDMCALKDFSGDSCAAVINFFTLHHVDLECMQQCFTVWFRVLKPGGALLVATWEGEGEIDYGEQGDITAVKHPTREVAQAATTAGFKLNQCEVRPVEGMEMDAVFLEARK